MGGKCLNISVIKINFVSLNASSSCGSMLNVAVDIIHSYNVTMLMLKDREIWSVRMSDMFVIDKK